MTEATLLPTAAPVSAEVSSFLAQLAVALHKQRAYPPGHPMRDAAQSAAFRALGALLSSVPSLRIGVARTQLIVDDTVTDPAHFVIRDLAVRLHRRQVGSLTLRAGLTQTEFADFLDRFTAESGVVARGTQVAPFTVESPHIEVSPIAFDALALGEARDASTEIERLWQELAVAVGAPGFGSGPGVGFAELLLERLGTPEARAAVAATVERMGRAAQELDGEEKVQAEGRLRELLATLPPEALGVLLDIDLGRRDELGQLIDAVDWLPALALVEVVESAARAQKQELSTVLLRLLQKLARQTKGPSGHRPMGDRDLREVVKSLLADWTLNDPNSRSHAHILDVLARHDFVTSGDGAPGDEAIRIVQMALETDAAGDHVTEAVERCVGRGEADDLVKLLDGVEPGPASQAIWETMSAPAQLRRILGDDRVSEASLIRILEHAAAEAAPVLIDRLMDIESGPVRSMIAERLVVMGPSVSLELLRRIEAVGPKERRQLLGMLAELPSLPEGLNVKDYLTSTEPLIRVEAYRLMLRRPQERDGALHASLADDDERVVRVAVEAGLERLPRQSLARLMLLLNSTRRSEELRADAVRILAQFEEPSIREWLLANLVSRRGWLQRTRLAPKAPLMLAKLRLLAQRWPEHPEAAKILARALKSADGDVVAAARGEVR